MPHTHSKAERNLRILAEYQGGDSYARIGQRHGISAPCACRIVHRLGGGASADRMRAYGIANGPMGGRKPIWPDCPEHLRERYEKAKKRIGAHAAKVKIQAQERHKQEIAARGPLAMVA